MATLPLGVDFTDASTTEAEFKTAISQQRDFLSGLLGTDGTTATARATLGVSTLSSVSGTAPVSVATGTTAPVISMAAATASVNGYMTSTYAAKLDGIAAGANLGVALNVGVGGVGMMALMVNNFGAVASGATVAGSSLLYAYWNGSTITTGTAATGTWRNITGATSNAGQAHTFQRIS